MKLVLVNCAIYRSLAVKWTMAQACAAAFQQCRNITINFTPVLPQKSTKSRLKS